MTIRHPTTTWQLLHFNLNRSPHVRYAGWVMAYDPKGIEDKWYTAWESGGYMGADPKSDKPKFSLVMPPPNVTGTLHMGHALVTTLQDVIVRWKRMSGFETLWVPGTDHAGIATQTVVERYLMSKEGKRRVDYPREEFVKAIWQWKDEHQGRILGQLRKMGCSCDWSRLRFTLDESVSHAVNTVFQKLYDDGLIYRGDYLVNWDPVTQTALADDEVEYEEESSYLWHINYPVEGTDEHLIIATTRPETMLGDTAVAVAPGDKRYAHLVGKHVRLPLVGRLIPIIADHHVDPEFGTGALKITPAHDPNDYEIGLRHDLPMINIMTPDGKILDGDFAGMSMHEARHAIVEKLGRAVIKADPHTHRVGVSYRSKAKIEPYLSKQWFVKITHFKDQLLDAIKSDVSILPKSWEQTYKHWIENLRDWCISRQLWWGHRIPVWYRGDDVVCAETQPEGDGWEQDKDVLDTWFSSALWPFSTLGWPEKTADFQAFYPNHLLITGHDILFFWVARMILMGYAVTDKAPFPQVFLHGLIFGKSYWRIDQGQIAYVTPEEKARYDLGDNLPKDVHSKWEKMSKSKGNIIDPIDLMNSYGTDAVRFALTASVTGADQIDLDLRRFEEYKNFINKIWNGAQFVFMHLGDHLDIGSLELEDEWIISRLSAATQTVHDQLSTYAFDKAASTCYNFFWNEFCAYYVEMCKPTLFAKKNHQTKQALLAIVLAHALALLHPIAPFVTEELFATLKTHIEKANAVHPLALSAKAILDSPVLMVAPYPKVDLIDTNVEATFSKAQDLVYAIRNIRAEMALPPSMPTDIYFTTTEDLTPYLPIIRSLVKCNTVDLTLPKLSFYSSAKVGNIEITIPLPLEMQAKEKQRLIKEQAKLEVQIANFKKKLANSQFIDNAPPALVEQTHALLSDAQSSYAKNEKLLASLSK